MPICQAELSFQPNREQICQPSHADLSALNTIINQIVPICQPVLDMKKMFLRHQRIRDVILVPVQGRRHFTVRGQGRLE